MLNRATRQGRSDHDYSLPPPRWRWAMYEVIFIGPREGVKSVTLMMATLKTHNYGKAFLGAETWNTWFSKYRTLTRTQYITQQDTEGITISTFLSNTLATLLISCKFTQKHCPRNSTWHEEGHTIHHTKSNLQPCTTAFWSWHALPVAPITVARRDLSPVTGTVSQATTTNGIDRLPCGYLHRSSHWIGKSMSGLSLSPSLYLGGRLLLGGVSFCAYTRTIIVTVIILLIMNLSSGPANVATSGILFATGSPLLLRWNGARKIVKKIPKFSSL